MTTEKKPLGLHSKLALVMSQLKRVEKRGYNKHFGYPFATSEDISDAIRGLLAEQGISFSQSIIPELFSREPAGKQMAVTVFWKMKFTDGETGESDERVWASEALDQSDKGINKAATAASKYFLLKNFIMSSGDEPDSDAGGETRDGAPVRKESSGQSLLEVELLASQMVARGDPKDDIQKQLSKIAGHLDPDIKRNLWARVENIISERDSDKARSVLKSIGIDTDEEQTEKPARRKTS